MKILYWAKNGVHAFGYNSAESEPSWMKSGATWAHCSGLALVDFGRDSHSSDVLRGRRNFVCLFLSSKEGTILLIFRRINWTKFQHNNVDRCRHVNIRNKILKILP